MNPLKAGDIAPKFSLPDQDGEQVNLTDFQGQRVLVYFSLASGVRKRLWVKPMTAFTASAS